MSERLKHECLFQIHADSLDPIAMEQIKLVEHYPALSGMMQCRGRMCDRLYRYVPTGGYICK